MILLVQVHNWTVDQTVAWLAESVELKQYAQNFYENAVNGSSLPRSVKNLLFSFVTFSRLSFIFIVCIPAAISIISATT